MATEKKAKAIEVAVTFAECGDGGRHDVVLVSPGVDAVTVWRGWKRRDKTLVVMTVKEPRNQLIYDTRWFSAVGEIELCGSGAVAAARVAFEELNCALNRVYLKGIRHDVVATRSATGVRIRLPHFDLLPFVPPTVLLDAVGLSSPKSCEANEALRTVVLELPRGRNLRGVTPDHGRLRTIRHAGLEALIVTTAASAPERFEYRYFTPWHGVDESQVAVSANALLGPYWRPRLNSDRLASCQLSRSRPCFTLEVNEEGTWVDSPSGVEQLDGKGRSQNDRM